MTTVQIRAKGTITFPAQLRSKYKLQEGEVFTVIDLGGGSFLFKPRIYEMDKISKQAEKTLKEDGVTLEELFETSREVRKEKRAGLKPPAQHMKALRAGERVRFSGLPRTEAGIYPAESSAERVVPLSVKALIFYH